MASPTQKPAEVSLPDRKRIRGLYDKHSSSYAKALHRIARRIRSAIARQGVNANVKSRVKSFDSYFEKLLRVRARPGRETVLTDVLGCRVICPFVEDLEAVERALHAAFTVVESERKGEKRSFREFAYDSIHLLVDLPADWLPAIMPHTRRVCEIQLRTILQDAWAEVEHEIVYKGGTSLLTEPIKRKLASLNATLALSDTIFQEIRDVQKAIQSRRERQQGSLHEQLEAVSSLSLIDTLGEPAPEVQNLAPALGSPTGKALEKLIFEALDAHGNNRFEQAVRIYTRILGLKPHRNIRMIIYNHRGMAHFALSQYEHAAKDFTRAIELNNSNFRAHTHRALCLRMLRRNERALQDLDRSIELRPNQSEAYYVRALTYYDLGDFVRALEECEKALNVDPGSQQALRLRKTIAARALQ